MLLHWIWGCNDGLPILSFTLLWLFVCDPTLISDGCGRYGGYCLWILPHVNKKVVIYLWVGWLDKPLYSKLEVLSDHKYSFWLTLMHCINLYLKFLLMVEAHLESERISITKCRSWFICVYHFLRLIFVFLLQNVILCTELCILLGCTRVVW
jgi:hypothetical protein